MACLWCLVCRCFVVVALLFCCCSGCFGVVVVIVCCCACCLPCMFVCVFFVLIVVLLFWFAWRVFFDDSAFGGVFYVCWLAFFVLCVGVVVLFSM